jgi:hypothetical protein
MPELRRGVRRLRLAGLPSDERDGIAAPALAAYDQSVDALAGMAAEIVDVALSARSMDAPCRPDPTTLVDNNTHRWTRTCGRTCAGAAISSRDYLVALGQMFA